MAGVNVLAIPVAAVVAFLISGGYYGALGDRLAQLSPVYAGPGPSVAATAAVELVRNAVLALVVAGLVAGLGLVGIGPALLVALALWLAFPVVLLSGSVFHEKEPAALAAIHAGDWLLKLLAITVILTLWR